MSEALIIGLITAALGSTALFTYLTKRLTAKPDATSVITEAAGNAVAALSAAVERLENELELTRQQLEGTKRQLTHAVEQNDKLLSEVCSLRRQVTHLTILAEDQRIREEQPALDIQNDIY